MWLYYCNNVYDIVNGLPGKNRYNDDCGMDDPAKLLPILRAAVNMGFVLED